LQKKTALPAEEAEMAEAERIGMQPARSAPLPRGRDRPSLPCSDRLLLGVRDLFLSDLEPQGDPRARFGERLPYQLPYLGQVAVPREHPLETFSQCHGPLRSLHFTLPPPNDPGSSPAILQEIDHT